MVALLLRQHETLALSYYEDRAFYGWTLLLQFSPIRLIRLRLQSLTYR